MQRLKKIGCVLLSAFVLTWAVPQYQVEAATASQLQAKRKALSKDTEKAMKALKNLESQKLSVQEEMDTVDKAMSSLQAEMDAAKADLESINAALEKSRKDLEEATTKRDQQFDLLGKRLKYLQQKGSSGYLEILLEAEGFQDLFLRMHYVNDIMEYDREILDELQAIQKTIQEKTKQIEEEQKAQKELVKLYDEKYAEMEKVLEEKKAKIAAYKKDMNKYQQLIDANKKADQEVLNQLARQQSPSGSSRHQVSIQHDDTVYPTGSGSMGWPVPSRSASSSSLSSGFVNRRNPVTGRQESHSGYDIPAGYGAAIVAAESGTVTYAGWMNGYGNTVMIDHGNGLSTLYGHNSSLTVSKGQTVQRGQTIAKCGSTGMSTGNHCHFSVLQNGAYVNPASYLGVPNINR